MSKLTDPQLKDIPEIQNIIELLRDAHFRCPAYRWDEEVGNENVVEESGEQWQVMAIPEGPFQGHYDEHGQCLEMVEIAVEYEYGEAGSILSSYPVILSNCASYHGYEGAMLGENSHFDELVTRYSERQQLLKKVETIVRGY